MLETHQLPISALARSYKMTLEIITDERTGLEIAYITNEDGTTLSMAKSTYDKQQAQADLPGGNI
jgi:hypothetical protein